MLIRTPSIMYEMEQEKKSQPAPPPPPPPQVAYLIPPPVQNPLAMINPYYTSQQPDNSLAPMQMLNQYRQTGAIPDNNSMYTTYTQPTQTMTQPTAAPTAAYSSPSIGGGK